MSIPDKVHEDAFIAWSRAQAQPGAHYFKDTVAPVYVAYFLEQVAEHLGNDARAIMEAALK